MSKRSTEKFFDDLKKNLAAIGNGQLRAGTSGLKAKQTKKRKETTVQSMPATLDLNNLTIEYDINGNILNENAGFSKSQTDALVRNFKSKGFKNVIDTINKGGEKIRYDPENNTLKVLKGFNRLKRFEVIQPLLEILIQDTIVGKKIGDVTAQDNETSFGKLGLNTIDNFSSKFSEGMSTQGLENFFANKGVMRGGRQKRRTDEQLEKELKSRYGGKVPPNARIVHLEKGHVGEQSTSALAFGEFFIRSFGGGNERGTKIHSKLNKQARKEVADFIEKTYKSWRAPEIVIEVLRAGLSGEQIIRPEFQEINQREGAETQATIANQLFNEFTETAIEQMVNSIQAKVDKTTIDQLINLTGSKSPIQAANERLAAIFLGKKVPKELKSKHKFKLVMPKNKGFLKEWKDIVKKTNYTIAPSIKLTVFPEELPTAEDRNSPLNLQDLIVTINRELNEYVQANMGKGGAKTTLNYRTGRFAESAQLKTLMQTKSGAFYGDVDYMRNPYSVFARGGSKNMGYAMRDPEKIINKSIRQMLRDELDTVVKFKGNAG